MCNCDHRFEEMVAVKERGVVAVGGILTCYKFSIKCGMWSGECNFGEMITVGQGSDVERGGFWLKCNLCIKLWSWSC